MLFPEAPPPGPGAGIWNCNINIDILSGLEKYDRLEIRIHEIRIDDEIKWVKIFYIDLPETTKSYEPLGPILFLAER